MSKTLEDILSGNNPAAEEELESSADTTIPATVNTADIDDNADATPTQVEPEEDSSINDTDDTKDSKDNVSSNEPESTVDDEDEIEPEQNTNTVVAEEPGQFESRIVHLNKAATLFSNTSGTKCIGSYKGTIKITGPAINGVAPIEYTVVACGNKLKKKAYIHI